MKRAASILMILVVSLFVSSISFAGDIYILPTKYFVELMKSDTPAVVVVIAPES